MTDKNTAAAAAGELLRAHYDGVLSTVSRDVEGYPFGSVMPFGLDRSGSPVMQVASIAQHTRNITADPRVSLIVFERRADDLQTHARLTLVGDAEPVNDEDTLERYFRRFPEARDYHRTHDFGFYRIAVKRCRWIGGFGEIFWLPTERVLQANPFTAAEEAGMVEHMNADHADAIALYCSTLGHPPAADETPLLTGVDASGFDMRLGERLLRHPFPSPVQAGGDVRRHMAALAKAARGEQSPEPA